MAGNSQRTPEQTKSTTTKRSRTQPRRNQLSDPANDLDAGESLVDVDHADEDDTLNSIRDGITSYSKKLGKKNDWPETFRKALDKAEAEVVQEMSEVKSKYKRDHDAFQERIASILVKALLPPDVENPEYETGRPVRVDYPTARAVTLHEHSEILLARSHNLIKTYKKISAVEVPESRLEGLKDAFESDKMAAIEAIQAGSKVARRDVENMLADRNNEARGRSSLTIEDEEKGLMVMMRGKSNDEEDGKEPSRGWGVVAQDTYRAVYRLAQVAEVED